jgi:hypothetical protein
VRARNISVFYWLPATHPAKPTVFAIFAILQLFASQKNAKSMPESKNQPKTGSAEEPSGVEAKSHKATIRFSMLFISHAQTTLAKPRLHS